ncbi:MAG: diaminopropionate ammonia-lyase [Geminicoccaceae bacterium]|nr:diaminopropionate ammonia-lyase [Geminicoccaceae bacterium]
MPISSRAFRPEAVRALFNPRARRSPSPAARGVLDARAIREAALGIRSWPGYAPTPLVRLEELADELGLGELLYKDESSRFGLGSFKALGGAYAVRRLVETFGAGLTVATATDGNHGRAVAWAARRFDCRCVVFVHERVSEGRKRAIAAFGAEVRVVPGSYDDAVRACAAEAAARGWWLVSDTAWPGQEDVPRRVMEGYALVAEEAAHALDAPPTHVFVQAGVGAFAAAIAWTFASIYGERRPRLAVVEPERAACCFASCAAGRRVAIGGDLSTVMAGLACGEPSSLAWPILDELADVFLTVPDEAAIAAMRLLARGMRGDPPIVAGESGVAGLAAVVALAHHPELRSRLDLGPHSRVLVFGTEGATDPELYARLVGATSSVDAEE